MSNKYILNEITNWSFLPWKQIYNKISIIEYKIFNATKNYDLKKLYKLQKKLLNSNEIKIVAIKNIIEKTYLYYLSKKKSEIFISNQQKFNLFKNCYNDLKKNQFSLYFLIKQIKKWIIYLSLKSEWKAKFIFNFNCYKKKLDKKSIINLLNNNIYRKNKFSFIKIITQKIKLLRHIEYFNSNKFLWINDIYIFIYKIYYHNINWYIQYIEKLHNLLKNKNKTIFLLSYLINLANNNNIKNFIYNKKIFISFLNKYTKIYLKEIFENHYLIILLIYKIKQNYLWINNILFYQLRRNSNIFLNKYQYFISNSKYLNKIFYILELKSIYNHYCL